MLPVKHRFPYDSYYSQVGSVTQFDDNLVPN